MTLVAQEGCQGDTGSLFAILSICWACCGASYGCIGAILHSRTRQCAAWAKCVTKGAARVPAASESRRAVGILAKRDVVMNLEALKALCLRVKTCLSQRWMSFRCASELRNQNLALQLATQIHVRKVKGGRSYFWLGPPHTDLRLRGMDRGSFALPGLSFWGVLLGGRAQAFARGSFWLTLSFNQLRLAVGINYAGATALC